MKHFGEVPAEAKFVKNSVAARVYGVCTKTLDRWSEVGIIQKSYVIRGMKYHELNALAAAGRRRG